MYARLDCTKNVIPKKQKEMFNNICLLKSLGIVSMLLIIRLIAFIASVITCQVSIWSGQYFLLTSKTIADYNSSQQLTHGLELEVNNNDENKAPAKIFKSHARSGT